MSGSPCALAVEPSPPATAQPCPPLPEVSLIAGGQVEVPASFDALAFYNTATGKELRDLSDRIENNTWTITNDDLTCPLIPYTDVKHIRLRWTKRGEGDKSPLCLQPIKEVKVTPFSAVTDISCEGKAPCYKGLGDQIWIQVEDLDQWIKERGAAKDRPVSQTVADLVPFFDGVALRGIHPENPGAGADWVQDFHTFHTLRFTLERNTSNRESWSRLLKGLEWDGRLVGVSVGFEGGAEMPTLVQKEPPRNDPEPDRFKKFKLVVLPKASTIGAAILFFAAVIAFFLLVRRTEILQDVSAPLRPDGKPPYSLARMQMAVWFFLVVAAWFLLFLVTKDIDTLTPSILILMGISAGTAVGSTIMDAGTTLDAADRTKNVPADPKDMANRVTELRTGLASAKARATANDEEREAKHKEIARLADELTLAESQQAFFRWRPWLRGHMTCSATAGISAFIASRLPCGPSSSGLCL
jgi:hypothetical protein